MAAEDVLADAVLDGIAVDDVVAVVTRTGRPGWFAGLDGLRRAVAVRRAEVVSRLDAVTVLEQLREPISEAVRLEYRTLFADPDDLARLEEAELIGLPSEPAAAWQALGGRTWRSPAAEVCFQQARETVEALYEATVGRAVARLDAVDAAQVAAVLDQIASRREDTASAELRWRRSAQDRLMAHLAPAPARRLRLAWTNLAGRSAGLADAVRQWHASPGAGPEGEPDLGAYLFAPVLDPIAEVADLDRLDHALAQDHPGASLDDIDAAEVAQLAGASAREDFEALRRAVRDVDPVVVRRRVPAMALRRGLTPAVRRQLSGAATAPLLVLVDRTGPADHWPAVLAGALAVTELVRRHQPERRVAVVVAGPGGELRTVRPGDLVDLAAAPAPTAPDDHPGPDPVRVVGALRRAAIRIGAPSERAVLLVLGDAGLGTALDRVGRRCDWTVRTVEPVKPGDPYDCTTATVRQALAAAVR